MEMIANKEPLAGASLIAPAFLQSNPVRTTNRKQPEKKQVNPVDTDFSERLSAALDQSGKRLEPAVKAADKRLLNKADSNKAASQDLEQPQTSVSTDLIPVVTKSDDQAVTNGMNALGYDAQDVSKNESFYRNHAREFFARVLAVFYYILGISPEE